MTQSELKQKLYDLISSYFSGATVIWGMTGAVNPNSPLITLNLSDVTRSYHPVNVNNDGVPVNYFPSTTKLQIDLFTKGREVFISSGEQTTTAWENTAIDDMNTLVNFLDSEYVVNWSELNDISISVNLVRDLTQLINTASWDYRAMCEVDIGFIQSAVGHTGLMWEGGVQYDEDGNPLTTGGAPSSGVFKPDSSGGGSEELAGDSTGWFEKAEIEEEK